MAVDRRPRHPVWPDVHLFETGNGRTDGNCDFCSPFPIHPPSSPPLSSSSSNTLSSSSSLIAYGMLFQLRAELPECQSCTKISLQHSHVLYLGTRQSFVAAWHLWPRVAVAGAQFKTSGQQMENKRRKRTNEQRRTMELS